MILILGLCYFFTADGVRTLDWRNVFVMRDGARYASWLRIPGPESADYQVNDVPHGTVSQVWYPSPTLGMKRRMYVYTPPGYETASTRYPVLYLLHGGGGDEEAWTELGCAMKRPLQDKGVKYTLLEVPGYGHEWKFWRLGLRDLLPRLFQQGR